MGFIALHFVEWAMISQHVHVGCLGFSLDVIVCLVISGVSDYVCLQ